MNPDGGDVTAVRWARRRDTRVTLCDRMPFQNANHDSQPVQQLQAMPDGLFGQKLSINGSQFSLSMYAEEKGYPDALCGL